MNSTPRTVPSNTSRRIYGFLDLVGATFFGVAIGLFLSEHLLRYTKQDSVGMTLLITSLIFGGAALSRFAKKRIDHPSA